MQGEHQIDSERANRVAAYCSTVRLEYWWSSDIIQRIAPLFKDEKDAAKILAGAERYWAQGDHYDIDCHVRMAQEESQHKYIKNEVLSEIIDDATKAKRDQFRDKLHSNSNQTESMTPQWHAGRPAPNIIPDESGPFSDDAGPGQWDDYMR